MFEFLGLPVAEDKLEGRDTQLTFLGLELDTITMEIRLPSEKLVTLQALIMSWLGRRSCSKRELESLVGSLSHAAQVVRCGKTFLRHTFELLAAVQKAHHFIRLNTSFKSDLQWWDMFLCQLNGRSLDVTSRFSVSFTTDASGSIGCGALWPPFWLQYLWPETVKGEMSCRDDGITFKELLPIVFTCAVLRYRWRNVSVRVFCDNMGMVAVVNSGYCKATQNNLDVLLSQVPVACHSCSPPPPVLVSLLLNSSVDWTSPTWS